VPVVAWWLIGDLSESPGTDYFMLRPLTLKLGSERISGALASVVAVVGLALVLRARWGRTALSVWDRALLLTLGAEVGAAFVYRVFTAGVRGANIGGGLLLLMGVPVVAFMLALAIVSLQGRDAVMAGSTAAATLGISVGHFVLGILSLWLSLMLLASAVAVAGACLWKAAPQHSP
jgi:hypothetical protein